MSFRLDWKGTLILTVVLVTISIILQTYLSNELYCTVMPIIWVAVLVAANWGWLKYKLGSA